MSELPRRRIVLDSTGKPREEVSEEGIREVVEEVLSEVGAPVGGTPGDPGELTLYFENALI